MIHPPPLFGRVFLAALLAGLPALLVGCPPGEDTSPGCGDGSASEDELCDGDDTKGESCVSQSFSGGALACAPGCQAFDTQGCSLCGNGLLEGDELCDGADVGDETCAARGYSSGELRCTASCDGFDEALCSHCGNAQIDVGEQCDGAELRGASCVSRGFSEGSLACLPTDCRYDVSGCAGSLHRDCCEANEGVPSCVDEDVAACVCDVDPSCCESSWDELCAALVESAGCGSCTPVCGNERVERGERCDGADTGGYNCHDLGFTGGPLRCSADCESFDSSECNGTGPICGNGVVEGLEACDGADLRGRACSHFRFDGGELACGPTCEWFDTSSCAASPSTSCGDGLVNGVGELCDGARFSVGGSTCAGFGMGDGVVACSDDCAPDLSSCSGGSDVCAALVWYNDGRCQPCHLLGGFRDADCDVACAADGVCSDEVIAGVWACSSAGVIDPDCGLCGDDIRSGSELCDGSVPSGVTCLDFGYAQGEILQCTAACVPDFSGCIAKGDCCSGTPGVPGCSDTSIEACVCEADAFCCTVEWDERCVGDVARGSCGVCEG